MDEKLTLEQFYDIRSRFADHRQLNVIFDLAAQALQPASGGKADPPSIAWLRMWCNRSKEPHQRRRLTSGDVGSEAEVLAEYDKLVALLNQPRVTLTREQFEDLLGTITYRPAHLWDETTWRENAAAKLREMGVDVEG